MSITAVRAAVSGYLEKLGDQGSAAIWFEHLDTGDVVQVNAEEVFPAASVIKVPILVEAFRQAEEGQICLESLCSVHEALRVGGSGVLKELHAGIAVTLRDLLTLMIIVSDNTATNMVIDLLGIERVNAAARRLGLHQTVLRRKLMKGAFFGSPDYSLATDNTISASDVGRLLRLIAGGEAVSPAADAEMVSILQRQQVNDRLPLLLPPRTRVAHKTGELRTTRHDAGVVYGAGGPLYVLVVLTRDLRNPPAAARQIAELSRDVWEALAAK